MCEKKLAYNTCERHLEAVNTCEAEVSELELAVGGDEHVLRFEVTVHDTLHVQEVNPTEQLEHQILATQTYRVTVKSQSLKVVGTIFTRSNYLKCKLICTSR